MCSNGGYKYYRYDMSGVRTEKTVGGVTHSYVTQNGKVVRESYGSKVLDFIYDAAGRPFALRYSSNGGSSFTTYYYRLNLQGDVIALVNTDGSTEAIYEYDAWGYPLYTSATTMSSINPLRYRGYYYDTETGWYYLQSRYYDPAVRRFINADSYAGTGQSFLGYNMFAYCENSPVFFKDEAGHRLNTCQMLTDSGSHLGEALPDKKTQTNDERELRNIYSLGFSEPQGAVNAKVNITKGTHFRSRREVALENIDKELRKTFFTFGISYFYTYIYILFTFNECFDNDSVSVPKGEYPCFFIQLEYDLKDPVTNDYQHYIEERKYLIVYNAQGDKTLFPLY